MMSSLPTPTRTGAALSEREFDIINAYISSAEQRTYVVNLVYEHLRSSSVPGSVQLADAFILFITSTGEATQVALDAAVRANTVLANTVLLDVAESLHR